MSCHTWKGVPMAIFDGVDISEVPGCNLLQQMSSQWVLLQLVSYDLIAYLSAFNLVLTQWIMTILSTGCKPDNFEAHNPLKLSITIIWGLHFNFLECESFLQCECEPNSPDILALCKKNLDKTIDSGNFSVKGYLPLIQKDSLLICMVLQFMWKKDFLLHVTYL